MRTLTDGAERTLAGEGPAPRPYKLAHFVIRTRNLPAMKAFYQTVLDAVVVTEAEGVHCGMTYDEEHHRLALIQLPDVDESSDATSETFSAGRLNDNKETDLSGLSFSVQPGLEHVAFTYASLAELVQTYVRLRDLGIRPAFCINHGPTVSMYYEDPDGIKVELQIDSMTVDAADEYIRSEVGRANVIGWPYDPEDLLERYLAGEPVGELSLSIGKP